MKSAKACNGMCFYVNNNVIPAIDFCRGMSEKELKIFTDDLRKEVINNGVVKNKVKYEVI